MSNALSIAAITAVLRDLLNNGLIDHNLTEKVGSVVQVTSKPPDLITTGPNEAPQLNLFLYQVTPNQGWRNVDLPSFDSGGTRVSNPPLPLDLHYILMAYGSEDFVAEILLGYAMQILHETPVLNRETLRKALGAAAPDKPAPVAGGPLPPQFRLLSAADLADQAEMIKITPEALNIEEVSKLWMAFQAHYRTTAAYKVSVVLIQSARPTRSTLPVLKPRIYPTPIKRPVISSVSSSAVPSADSRITVDSTLEIRGVCLRGGDRTSVYVEGEAVPPACLRISDTLISFPMDHVPKLRAGVRRVQVVHELLMGEPPQLHVAVESNVAAFVLHPVISRLYVSQVSKTINVNFCPPVGRRQRVTLSLYPPEGPGQGDRRSYSLPSPNANDIEGVGEESSAIRFSCAEVEPGEYLAYIQVDGAESVLRTDAAGKFDLPRVKV